MSHEQTEDLWAPHGAEPPYEYVTSEYVGVHIRCDHCDDECTPITACPTCGLFVARGLIMSQEEPPTWSDCPNPRHQETPP